MDLKEREKNTSYEINCVALHFIMVFGPYFRKAVLMSSLASGYSEKEYFDECVQTSQF